MYRGLGSSIGDSSDGQFGSFVDGLGPGQIVGRQVLGSPCMGEVQLSIADRKGQLEVEVIRARALGAKPGAKVLPGQFNTRPASPVDYSAHDFFLLSVLTSLVIVSNCSFVPSFNVCYYIIFIFLLFDTCAISVIS